MILIQLINRLKYLYECEGSYVLSEDELLDTIDYLELLDDRLLDDIN